MSCEAQMIINDPHANDERDINGVLLKKLHYLYEYQMIIWISNLNIFFRSD